MAAPSQLSQGVVAANGPGSVTEDQARAHVRDIVEGSDSSFFWGMRLLPRARRQAMYALYAYCRAVDDIADEPGDRGERQRELDRWRAEIGRLYAGHPTGPITSALRQPVAAFDLPQAEFLAIIDGMEMDLSGTMCAPSVAELEAYCRRVAGAVGRLSIRIFGAREPEAEALALSLGEALQLTNILRDLWEDAARGRLYLPRELLDTHGIATRIPSEVLSHAALPRVCAELAARARERFRHSRALLERCDRRRLRPSIVMMEVYERLLARMERRGWRRQAARVRVSRAEKIWIVLRYGLI